jgi:hypothetical protein
MDQHTLNFKVFVRSLTESQLDTCESDEKRLQEIASEGLSEENAVRFARAMYQARRANPDANVDGVFETALQLGFLYLGNERTYTGLTQVVREVKAVPAQKRKRGVRGV